jgi:hypothetical protein
MREERDLEEGFDDSGESPLEEAEADPTRPTEESEDLAEDVNEEVTES